MMVPAGSVEPLPSKVTGIVVIAPTVVAVTALGGLVAVFTPLLQAARARGARVMTGRELCIYQAADAFRLFTGLEASRERIGAAFDAVIAKRNEAK